MANPKFPAYTGKVGHNDRGYFVDVYDQRGFLIDQVVKTVGKKKVTLFKTAGAAVDEFMAQYPTDDWTKDWKVTIKC